MVLSPAIIALLAGGSLIALVAAAACVLGVRILRSWDLADGSEGQLNRERQTYLVSTVLAYVMVFELLSFFLFVATCDRLHPLFTGAMCAAGVLDANALGYPALLLKALNSILCGLWLILNAADNRAPDYPLIRWKYAALIPIALLLMFEACLLWGYFLNLRADTITSCCGSQFGTGSPSLASNLAALPVKPAVVAFYASFGLMLAAGVVFLRTGKLGGWFALLSLAFFGVALAALLSFVSLYIYQLPTHHCPFCMLQREYAFVGFPLYLFLFVGVVCGSGVGVLGLAGRQASLAEIVPARCRRLVLAALICYTLFTAIATVTMFVSPLYLWE